MLKLEIKSIGNSAGLILPKEALALLHVKKGDSLYPSETPEGFLLSPYDPEVGCQLETAEDIMQQDRDVLKELAKLMADAGLIVLAAFISPFWADRKIVRDILPGGQFVEVFMDAPLDVCKERDPRGLYAKAERGEIRQFTGIDSPDEVPLDADARVDAGSSSIPEGVNQLLGYLHEQGALQSGYREVVLGSSA